MGIVNVTPDSFYDGGATATTDLAVARALAVVSEGATVIDVGGMTARPGVVLSAADEMARVLPVLEGIRAAGCEAVVSVDTYRADVAAAALEAGADMINDHTGLTDGDLAAAVAEHGGGLVVTHLGLAPKQVQAGRYDIDPADIGRFLSQRAELAVDAGIDRSALVIDPGLGFGKSTATDLATLRALPDLLRARLSPAPGLLTQGGDRGAAGPARVEHRGHGRRGRRGRLPGRAAAARARPAVHGAGGDHGLAARRRRHVLTPAQACGGDRSGANSGRNRPSR